MGYVPLQPQMSFCYQYAGFATAIRNQIHEREAVIMSDSVMEHTNKNIKDDEKGGVAK